MTVRDLLPEDVPVLRELYKEQGFDYQFPDLLGTLMESIKVVVDENGKILCAVAAERIVQLYFLTSNFGPPHARLHAMRLLHEAMKLDLARIGYSEANAFIPPEIDLKFGKWLSRRFGWFRNWVSYGVKVS